MILESIFIRLWTISYLSQISYQDVIISVNQLQSSSGSELAEILLSFRMEQNTK